MLKSKFYVASASGEVFLPVDYHAGFVSLIKSAFRKYSPSLFEFFFASGKPTPKPYAFAVTFGDEVKVEDDKVYFFKPIEFKFTSNSPEILTIVYNFLVSEKTVKIYNLQFQISPPEIIRPRRITSDEVIFSTHSPVLIRSHRNPNYYLCPACENFGGDEDFDEALCFSVREIVNNFADVEWVRGNPGYDENICFRPIKLRKIVAKYFKNSRVIKMPGFVGTFRLSAHPYILNLINQVGLGSRRGMGYGMVEAIKEI